MILHSPPSSNQSPAVLKKGRMATTPGELAQALQKAKEEREAEQQRATTSAKQADSSKKSEQKPSGQSSKVQAQEDESLDKSWQSALERVENSIDSRLKGIVDLIKKNNKDSSEASKQSKKEIAEWRNDQRRLVEESNTKISASIAKSVENLRQEMNKMSSEFQKKLIENDKKFVEKCQQLEEKLQKRQDEFERKLMETIKETRAEMEALRNQPAQRLARNQAQISMANQAFITSTPQVQFETMEPQAGTSHMVNAEIYEATEQRGQEGEGGDPSSHGSSSGSSRTSSHRSNRSGRSSRGQDGNGQENSNGNSQRQNPPNDGNQDGERPPTNPGNHNQRFNDQPQRRSNYRGSMVPIAANLVSGDGGNLNITRPITNQSNQILKRLYNQYLDIKPWNPYKDQRNAARVLHQWQKSVQPYCESEGDEINSFCALMRGEAQRWAESSTNQGLQFTEFTRRFLARFYSNQTQLKEMNYFMNSEYPQVKGETIAEFMSFWWSRLEFNNHITNKNFVDIIKQKIPRTYSHLIELWVESNLSMDRIIEKLELEAAQMSSSKQPMKIPVSWVAEYTGKAVHMSSEPTTTTAKATITSQNKFKSKWINAKKASIPEAKILDEAEEGYEYESDNQEPLRDISEEIESEIEEEELIAAVEQYVRAKKAHTKAKVSGNARGLVARAQPSTKPGNGSQSPNSIKEVSKLMPAIWNSYQIIGDSHMCRFVNQMNSCKGSYHLCKPGYRLNELLNDIKVNPRLSSNKVIIHIGSNDVYQANFAADVWRAKFKELLKLLETKNPELKSILLLNITPALDQKLDYWKNLEEINSAIWLESLNFKNKAKVFNLFRKFAQRKNDDEFQNIREWRYVDGDKIIYDPKLAMYQRINAAGQKDLLHWNEQGNSVVEYGLKHYLKMSPNEAKTVNIIDKLTDGSSEGSEADVYENRDLIELYSDPEDILDDTNEPIASTSQQGIAEMKTIASEIEDDEVAKRSMQKLKRIDGRPEIGLTIGDQEERGLIDSGASHVLIDEKLFEDLCQKNSGLIKTIVPCRGSSKTFQQATGKAQIKPVSTAVLTFKFSSLPTDISEVCETPVTVIRNLNAKILLGRSFIDDFEIDIQHPRRQIELSFPGYERRHTIPYICKQNNEINLADLPTFSANEWYANTAISHARVASINIDDEYEVMNLEAVQNFPKGLGGRI